MKHISLIAAAAFIIINSCKQESPVAPNENKNQTSAFAKSTSHCNNPDSVSHFISLDYAYSMVNAYQDAVKKDRLCEIVGGEGGGGWIYSETFPHEAIQKILDQDGCCRFRIYYGLDRDNRLHLILVGVDSKDEDILYARSPQRGVTANGSGAESLNLIVEIGVPCPQACGGVYQY